MAQTNKMMCSDCGVEMNLHALKIDYGSDHSETVDPVFGGVLKEAHTCPECGRTELKSA